MWLGGGGEHTRDHKTHVAGLVNKVGFVRTAWGVCILEREDRRGNDISSPRPGPQ